MVLRVIFFGSLTKPLKFAGGGLRKFQDEMSTVACLESLVPSHRASKA